MLSSFYKLQNLYSSNGSADGWVTFNDGESDEITIQWFKASFKINAMVEFHYPKPFKLGAWQVYGNYDYPEDSQMYVGSFAPLSSTKFKGHVKNITGAGSSNTPLFRIFAIGR